MPQDDNHIHTTTHGAHILFQTIILYGCNLADNYDINMLQINLSCTKFFGEMKCVFSVHISHIWVQYNPLAKNMGIRSASVPVFVLFLSGPL